MSPDDKNDWRAFQEKVADLFRRVPGCAVAVGEVLRGARIGSVEVDVVAYFGGQPDPTRWGRSHKFVFSVVVECKYWRRPIPQEKLFALKAIVDDVGAAKGILVSEAGVQRGAREYLATPTNIMALTFTDLQAFALGLELAACTMCGQQTAVPFRVTPGRDVYCHTCFSAMNPRRLPRQRDGS